MTIVFSCNRPKMLLEILKHLDNYTKDVLVLDDASKYNYDEHLHYADYYRSHDKLGKENYWMQWEVALEAAKASESDLFIFMPDDFERIDIETIRKIHEELKDRAYSCNIINDGRESQFRPFTPIPRKIVGLDFKEIGFNDCGFFCNRLTLELIGFRMNPIHPHRFVGNEGISSGVGQQLTQRMRNNGIFMLMPVKSLAYHGEHKSEMHPKERIKNPLISK